MDEPLKRIHESLKQVERSVYISSEKKRARVKELKRIETFAHDYARKNEGTDFDWEKFWKAFRRECYPNLRWGTNEYRRIYYRVRRLFDPKFEMWLSEQNEKHYHARKDRENYQDYMRIT